MRYRLFVAGAVMAVSACTKSDVAVPVFDVSFENKVYKAGDTVIFHLTGNAENVVFYPGTPGNDYDHIKRVEAEGAPVLNFTTTLNNAGEVNTLQLLASTDFSGRYVAEDVQVANWTDITSRALLATSATARASGNVSLSDFLNEENKPLYLAFRYLGYQHATLRQPRWALTAFTVNNVLPDATVMPVTVAAETGWTQVDFKNPTTQWITPATGLISIDGTTVVNEVEKLNEDNDDWAITKPLNLKRANPDTGIPLKNVSNAQVNTYPYVYSKAGTYRVVFVGFNADRTSREEIIREFNLEIRPEQ